MKVTNLMPTFICFKLVYLGLLDFGFFDLPFIVD
jgi:hypothetical protein